MVDESLRIRRFDEIPSPAEFTSQIEPKNVPAVFKGCIRNWKAFSTWNPSNGGLDYLQECVGSSVVEAMLSRSAPIFYGDIRRHERVPLPFSTFSGYCNDLLQSKGGGQDLLEPKKDVLAEPDGEQSDDILEEKAPQQTYLAQVPIFNTEKEKVQLGYLREDILTPAFLETKDLASINLWMNSAQTRSSTHYDPHHNLLCIVAGCKQVTLWPPSSTPLLYPLPLYGEASNHSAVAIENADLSLYPRAKHAHDYSQKLVLHAGDALFIPEGWKSISGYAINLGPNLVSWCSKKQPTVARSSTEAEYRTMAHSAAELKWLSFLFQDLSISILVPVLHCDNTSAMALASNPVFHARTKHIEIDYHFVKEQVVVSKAIQLVYLASKDQVADLFTKSLS